VPLTSIGQHYLQVLRGLRFTIEPCVFYSFPLNSIFGSWRNHNVGPSTVGTLFLFRLDTDSQGLAVITMAQCCTREHTQPAPQRITSIHQHRSASSPGTPQDTALRPPVVRGCDYGGSRMDIGLHATMLASCDYVRSHRLASTSWRYCA
jgi:hypothetical protein